MGSSRESVIIVGNGSSVLDHPLGERIDRFDIVVRINNFQVKGYEQYVGSKTTVWVRNRMRDIKARDVSEFRHVLIYAPLWAHDDPSLWVRLARVLQTPAVHWTVRGYPSWELVDANTLARLEAALNISGRKMGIKWKYPSTGLIALAYMVERHPQVTIHGFDHFQDVDKKARHYFDNRQRMWGVFLHEPAKERSYVQALISRGYVSRLVDIPLPDAGPGARAEGDPALDGRAADPGERL